MIECPNLVFVNDQPVLIFCPQGLDKSIASYDNIYPNMYLVGKNIDLSQAKFTPAQKAPKDLDDGFDVYATQAFNAPDGNAYAISWVGLPDCTYPTDDENWANTYSQVKRLEVKDNELYQHPLDSIKSLRMDHEAISNQAHLKDHTSNQYELKLTIQPDQSGKLFLNADSDLKTGLILDFNTGDSSRLIIDRSNVGPKVNPEYGEQREVLLDLHHELNLDIFVDGSLCEIFINDGKNVATLRFFANPENQTIAFDHDLEYDADFWKMMPIM